MASPVSTNHHQAIGAVVQRSRKHNTDHAWAMGECSRTKRRINCRTIVIFVRPANKPETVRFDDHVSISRCDVDGAFLKGLAVIGSDGVEAASAV